MGVLALEATRVSLLKTYHTVRHFFGRGRVLDVLNKRRFLTEFRRPVTSSKWFGTVSRGKSAPLGLAQLHRWPWQVGTYCNQF